MVLHHSRDSSQNSYLQKPMKTAHYALHGSESKVSNALHQGEYRIAEESTLVFYIITIILEVPQVMFIFNYRMRSVRLCSTRTFSSLLNPCWPHLISHDQKQKSSFRHWVLFLLSARTWLSKLVEQWTFGTVLAGQSLLDSILSILMY